MIIVLWYLCDYLQYIQEVRVRGRRGSDRSRIESDSWAALGNTCGTRDIFTP
jgi:hypothetical protein